MTNPNTGKVPLTVPVTVNLPAPEDGHQWSTRLTGGPFTYRAEFEQTPIVPATVKEKGL